MKKPVIIIGAGEMGGVFARGFLRNGYPVYPVTREMDLSQAAAELPDPALVLIAVGEKDLQAVLENLPEPWRHCCGMLQNELLPRDWQTHNLTQPTVISVWFEKKKGQDYKVIIPSPVIGANAGVIADSLALIDIPCDVVNNDEDMLYELVRKNVYILTTNIAGLVTQGNVENLWNKHHELATTIAKEVIQIQAILTQSSLPEDRLIDGMEIAIRGDLNHMCMGRSAPSRLDRAIMLADNASLKTPKIREIKASFSKKS